MKRRFPKEPKGRPLRGPQRRRNRGLLFTALEQRNEAKKRVDVLELKLKKLTKKLSDTQEACQRAEQACPKCVDTGSYYIPNEDKFVTCEICGGSGQLSRDEWYDAWWELEYQLKQAREGRRDARIMLSAETIEEATTILRTAYEQQWEATVEATTKHAEKVERERDQLSKTLIPLQTENILNINKIHDLQTALKEMTGDKDWFVNRAFDWKKRAEKAERDLIEAQEDINILDKSYKSVSEELTEWDGLRCDALEGKIKAEHDLAEARKDIDLFYEDGKEAVVIERERDEARRALEWLLRCWSLQACCKCNNMEVLVKGVPDGPGGRQGRRCDLCHSRMFPIHWPEAMYWYRNRSIR